MHRITPACAGKTFCLASEKLLIRDHPRMCGKDRHTGRYPRKGIGSPPHVRERRLVYNIRTGGRRITPACAGKTEHRLSWSCLSKDHPRMCGKDIGKKVSFSYLLGSPPHVRERRWRTGKPARKSRITPACAGKTDSQARLVRSAGDHPRMCGKDCRAVFHTLLQGGSPPHVRERLDEPLKDEPVIRITPACAGKTSVSLAVLDPWRDHPRMCGKDGFTQSSTKACRGSPPHVRERPRIDELVAAKVGITPACAGKTSLCVFSLSSRRDHPRMCGKDTEHGVARHDGRGSPPHVRERQ